MKIVLDANILISASFWRGNPRAILVRVAKGSDTLFITDEIIAEFERVIKKPKFRAAEEEKMYIIRTIKEISSQTIVTEHIATGGCRDKTDDKYLECAIAAKADYIISGDKDLLVLKEYRGVKIVTANKFLELANN